MSRFQFVSVRDQKVRSASVVVGLASGLLVAGCHTAQKPVTKPPVVGFITLEARAVPLERDYVARTDAFYTVDVRPRISGELIAYNFIDGQQVAKGRLLFQLDPAPYRIAVQAAQAHLAHARSDEAEALAQLHKAEADVARYEPLAKIHAIPEQDLADAHAAVQVREAQVKQAQAEIQVQQTTVSDAQLKLSYTRIYSPISGTIGERQVDPGNLVSADEKSALATVSTDNPILVSFSVSDADYLKIFARLHGDARREKAPRYQLLLADGSTYSERGSFRAISRALSQQTDTLTVVLTFPNPHHVLRPGQFVQVRAALEHQPDAMMIPITAVHELQGTQTVLLVDDSGKAVERTIHTAGRQGDMYIVTGGVKPGDHVIVEGRNKVEAGDKVNAHVVRDETDTGSQGNMAGFQS